MSMKLSLNKQTVWIGLALSAFFSQAAYATNTATDLKLAKMLIEQGEPKEALDFLVNGLDSTSTNVNEWFLMGMAAKLSQRPRQAKSYLEKVVELAPAHSDRAKLELAQLSYALGDVEKSKTYLEEIKAHKPPAQVGANIDQFLDQIDKQGAPKSWRLTASLGWLDDSNANAGPEINSVLMFGLPFTLSNTAKKSHDTAWLLNLGFNHNAGITDDLGWQSNISINRTDYNKLNTIDYDVVSASSGPSLRVTDKLILSSPMVADWVRVGHLTSYYSYSYGLAPQLRYILTDKASFNLGSSFSKKIYHQNKKQGGYNYSASSSLAYQMNPSIFSSAGMSVGRQGSKLKFYKYDYWVANAMAGYSFRNILQFSAHISYTDSLYAGKEAAYTSIRHDKLTNVGANITYHINPLKADLLLASSVTKNLSNLPIYKYNRIQTTVSLSKSF